MPRQARRKSDSGIYHVMLRGINRAAIFLDDEDRRMFITTLTKALKPSQPGLPETEQPVGAEVLAWCLMDNHVHLLLREGSDGLSLLFKRFGVSFTAWYNRKYQRTGHLFQDRFRSEPVDDDSYFLAVFRYVCRNPDKAGICPPGRYHWCGFRFSAQGAAEIHTIPPDAALPTDISTAELAEYILAERDDIEPFPERIPDSEAEAVLLRICRLASAADFCRLSSRDMRELFPLLTREGLTLRQISRLTGVASSTLSRWLA